MATWLGHGIVGAAVAKAAGAGPGGRAIAFALANVPDLDIPLGLAVKGDGDAFHRAWWSHSPIVALYGVVGAVAVYALMQALRRRPLRRREARSWALFTALVLLTHPVTDVVLINPIVLVPHPDIDSLRDLPLAAGRELLALGTDLVFYSLLIWALYQLYLRLRQRYRRWAA
jgi:hypothetical protein